jgi:DNA-binding response OmpR family regulator
MAATSTILLAEEDPRTRAFLQDNLSADGYLVLAADDREQALALLCTKHPDLVVVDINGETLALVDAVRAGDGVASKIDPDTPIIVLSRRQDHLQQIRLLERGGDDVVSKPFSYPELRARIAALLRRAQTRVRPQTLRAGVLSIDLSAHEVRVADRRVEVLPTEYRLLVTLAREPARVFTKAELLREAWGFRCSVHTRTVESHAHRLRRKLADAGAPGLVRTVRGVGLQLCDAPR